MLAANWIMGLLLLSTMAVKLNWGADLVASACCAEPTPPQELIRNGPFHLGVYFMVSSLCIYGALGFLLLRNPYEAVPTWFAIPCLLSTVECILAWNFLRPEIPHEDDIYDSP